MPEPIQIFRRGTHLGWGRTAVPANRQPGNMTPGDRVGENRAREITPRAEGFSRCNPGVGGRKSELGGVMEPRGDRPPPVSKSPRMLPLLARSLSIPVLRPAARAIWLEASTTNVWNVY
jgi:hypothetical protein